MTILEHHYQISETAGARLRGPEREPGFLLAVTDRGRIKTLRFSTNGMSSKLQGKRRVVNKRTVALEFVTLSEEARRLGWQLLEDLYEAEEVVRESDCLAVYEWYRQVSYRKSGRVKPINPVYLPDGLKELRAGADEAMSVDLPPPERAVSKAEAKRVAAAEKKAAIDAAAGGR